MHSYVNSNKRKNLFVKYFKLAISNTDRKELHNDLNVTHGLNCALKTFKQSLTFLKVD
jgi:hypothetical protein